jgi:hypothetical protein
MGQPKKESEIRRRFGKRLRTSQRQKLNSNMHVREIT